VADEGTARFPKRGIEGPSVWTQSSLGGEKLKTKKKKTERKIVLRNAS